MSEIKSNRAWREECESLRQQLASRDAEVASLKAENESLLKNLRGKHALTGATYEHLIKERDQLRDQVKMLRDELLWHKEHTYNPFEPDNQCNAHKRICEALAVTEQKPYENTPIHSS